MTNPQLHPQAPLPFSSAEPVAQVNATLQDEIRLLRERGLSDECIHGLFSGFNIDANPEPSGSHWKLPVNDQLISLIWGNALPTPIRLD